MIEIIITLLIVIFSVYIIYKNIKNKANGKCSCCHGCTAHCANYKGNEIKKQLGN